VDNQFRFFNSGGKREDGSFVFAVPAWVRLIDILRILLDASCGGVVHPSVLAQAQIDAETLIEALESGRRL